MVDQRNARARKHIDQFFCDLDIGHGRNDAATGMVMPNQHSRSASAQRSREHARRRDDGAIHMAAAKSMHSERKQALIQRNEQSFFVQKQCHVRGKIRLGAFRRGERLMFQKAEPLRGEDALKIGQ